MTPRIKPCPSCGQMTRRSDVRAADEPGTVLRSLIDGTCQRCRRRQLRRGEAKPMRAFSYTNCTECDRPLVPQLTTPPEGHVRHKAKGVCVPCYSKRANQLKPKTTTAAGLAKVEHDRRNLEGYLAERRARLAQGRGAA